MIPRDQALKEAVTALAQDARVQAKIFPEFTEATFELVTGFEESFRPSAVGERGDAWSGEQFLRLRALDEKLKRMSDANDDVVWDDDNCLDHPDWEEVRRLAREVLQAFGWPLRRSRSKNE